MRHALLDALSGTTGVYVRPGNNHVLRFPQPLPPSVSSAGFDWFSTQKVESILLRNLPQNHILKIRVKIYTLCPVLTRTVVSEK